MRSALTIGRLCLRQAPRLRPPPQCRIPVAPRRFHSGGSDGRFWRQPPKRPGLILAAAASLTPAAFAQLSEVDNGGTDETAESRMLAASREEIAKEIGDDEHGFHRFKHSVTLCLDLYIWEPLCTGLRFLHLVFIFVPVIVTVPVIWCGQRDKKRSNERWGTLWWYSFLVQSMERAGPAFIKVLPTQSS
jgi:aarF domain-containing kinase